jgi:hypothetical protein
MFFFSCAQKLDNTQAEDVIKSTFKLTKEDSLEILGISMEEKNLAIVKFKLNEVQRSSKMRKYDKGWQLDQILNEFGVWVPPEFSLITTKMEEEKQIQMRAMKDIAVISTGIALFIKKNGYAPKQDGTYDEKSNFYIALSPFYIKHIKDLPIKDPWGNNYRVYCGKACNGKYGITDSGIDDFIVCSYGLDGEKEVWEFDPSNPEAGLFIVEELSDLNKDLVMWDGSWIRAPKKYAQY